MKVKYLIFAGGLLAATVIGAIGWFSSAWAESPYLPDHPLVPTIINNEGPSGALGLPPLNPPAPKGFDQQSIWNMKVVGFAEDLCSNSDQMWAETQVDQNQVKHTILYAGAATGTMQNQVCGVRIYDVTNPAQPQLLSQIPGDPAGGGAPHVFVCSGNTLPHATSGHYYLLTHRGNTSAGQGRHEIWDVTNPSAPTLVTTIVNGLSEYHRSYWECDTGIAYLVAGGKADGWKQGQHIYIYDLSNPYSPKFIRQYGLPGGQPSANIATQPTCTNSPGPNCYEGTISPPPSVHECYSTSTGVMSATGTPTSVVMCGYGVGANGVLQILDRTKLLTGCTSNPNASPDCADLPTQKAGPSQADLLYPQIGYVPEPPYIGGHNFTPIFNMPIPQDAGANYPTSPLSTTNTLGPQAWDVAVSTSEALGPPTCGTSDFYDHNATLVDITNQQTPWPIATLNVPQNPGNFCQKGGRFGDHFYSWHIYAPYYGKLACITWFNAGMRCFDIRDPLNPRMVAYFIQAPNANTIASCGVPGNPTLCLNAPFMDVVEVDDRGYIYGQDRNGSGITILLPTGDALAAVQGSGSAGK
jgi:hypothetical protein